MESAQPSVLARDDTFFGVCHALGEDLGFNPTWLRLGFALALFFNPLMTLGVYAGLGLFVAVLRWLVPNPRVAVAADQEKNESSVQPSAVSADDQMELSLAA